MKTCKWFFILLVVFSMPYGAFAQNREYVQYINQHKELAMEQMKRFHVPASITLAQGLLESGAGKSPLAGKSNNHFGIKCHDWNGKKTYYDDDARDECFRVYRSVKDSYEDHSMFLATKPRYAFLFQLEPTDYVGWARGLKKAGYATAPGYADQLINLIESYGLDRYDRYDKSEIRFMAPHQPRVANGLVYVIARQGDTLQGIADEFKTSKRRLISYNDLYKGYVPNKNDIIYLHRKNRKALKPYTEHVVKDGESMYMISQMYGIRLSRLYKMNKVSVDTFAPQVGDVIKLR